MKREPGKWEQLAYERHERDLKHGASRGLLFDGAAADHAVQFFESYCRHHKAEWAGRPFLLSDFQRFCIRSVFGWKRADGTRRFRTAWNEVPRKNGKTETGAGVGLYMLLADQEPGAEVYVTATKRDQAAVCWDAAAAMTSASPALRRFIRKFRSSRSLVCERLGGKFLPLGADSKTLDALNASCHLPDEVHAHRDPLVWILVDTSMAARRQPLTFAMTTAGVYDAEAIGWQKHDYAQKVLEGLFEDDSFFAFIACLDEDDDPFDPATWAKANPNLGTSVKESYLSEAAAKAKREPTFYSEFLRLHLNVWTQQVTRWLSVERWNECDGKALDLDALRGAPCWGGLDLSSKLDLTCFSLVFALEDGTVAVLLRSWIPEATVAAEAKKGRRHYQQWIDQGHLVATPGEIIDYGFIRREVRELAERFSIQSVGFDPWNATQIATELRDQDGVQMVELRQGYKTLSEPAKDFEARIVSRRVRHGGNPVMRWAVSNAVLRRDANGNIAPDKEHATDKIDPVVATIMALSRANVGESAEHVGELFV